MKRTVKRITPIISLLIAAVILIYSGAADKLNLKTLFSQSQTEQTTTAAVAQTPTTTQADTVSKDEKYYSLEEVIIYLDKYETLPENFLTKSQAKALGWNGGSLEKYRAGAVIGGDNFGNREGVLPKDSGRKYYECDMNTLGKSSRGACRLVYSSDWHYYYTEDHYETFYEYIVSATGEVMRNGKVYN